MGAPAPGRSIGVFISVGHGQIPQNAALVRLISDFLVSQGITPLAIERHVRQIGDPVGSIRSVVQKSAGTIVIATARYRATGVMEFPNGSNARPLPDRNTTTVWNQIEAAMTLQCQHPLLILCEEGLTYEGIIDPSIHPLIMYSPDDVKDQLPAHICEALSDWCKWL